MKGEIIRGGILLILAAAGLVTFIVWTIKRAEDPARRLFKWVLTAPVVCGLIFWAAPLVGRGGYAGAGGIPITAALGLVLAIIWRRDISELIAKPFASLYDGGQTPPEPRPAYSVAQARQKQGRYTEAIAEIRSQLSRFPTDVEGHMLLAQIQAENLHDLPGAELTILRLCAQPGHGPRNIVFALYSLADWHLKFGQDREAAQRALEKVIELLPDTEFALGAAQRIAHLGQTGHLLSAHDRKTFAVPEGIRNLGLAQVRFEPRQEDPLKQAEEYVRHLEQHPLDCEAREKLAVLYTTAFGRMDLASDQLEQLISHPDQPARLIAHWLNLLADLQIRAGEGYDAVRATLQRIIDRDPDKAAAEMARNRINLLKLELKALEKTGSVKMGAYEQNIGLRSGPPKPPLSE